MTKDKKFTRENILEESDQYAVYIISNSREILNIGEGHLKTRLRVKKGYVLGATRYRYHLIGNKAKRKQMEYDLLDAYRKKHGRLPKFNPIMLGGGGKV